MDLQTFFSEHPSIALGFSGGVDSSYLLYAGLRYGAHVGAYFVKTAFQPEFELRDACRIAGQLKAKFTVLHKDVLTEPKVASNPENRCYYCKRMIFETLKRQAAEDGFSVLIDGTNASDDAGDRPGMKALSELSVRSPLRECGITKEEIRRLAKEAGLFTWDKPAYACLATRIPAGRQITEELLLKVEASEDALFAMGFTDFRVRVLENAARLQFPEEQMTLALAKREMILKAVQPHFLVVLMDLNGR